MLRRTLAVTLVPALVIAAAWLRLEEPRDEGWRLLAIVALALVPAFVRPRLPAAGAALVLGLLIALDTWHPLRAASRFKDGFLDFYDVHVPFDPRTHADMRAVVLVAILCFTLAFVLALVRPAAAVAVLLVGAGWPATLAGSTTSVGLSILVAAFVVLAVTRSPQVPRVAYVVAAAVAFAALLASSWSTVAKGALVNWENWDFYNAPDKPVSVSYVWNAQYGGITFPKKRTTVLEIKAPRTSLYWRAAVLDFFAEDHWREADLADVPEPRGKLVRQDVTVKALSDTRLPGASVPVRFDAGDAPLVRTTGKARLPSGLSRGFKYTVWSYAPQPDARELAASKPAYPKLLTKEYLDVWPGVAMPRFGSGQPAVVAQMDEHPEIAQYTQLEKIAFAVAGKAKTPFAAASALESWFRVKGGFTYSNHPPIFASAPLVGFVAQTRSGYCQHFAGAMALMLRYLGVPARVAVGFSSGTCSAGSGVWTVTDHDAHAWVEAWFRGYGWLPFDPTPTTGRPARGQLSAAYAVRRSAPPPAPAQTASRHREGVLPTASNAPLAVRDSGGHGSLFVLLAAIAGAVLVGVVATKLVTRRVRYLSRDPRRVAAACRRELADFLLDQRIESARSATLHELGALVRDELTVDPDAFVAAATAARFGPPDGAPAAARRARRELRALLRRLRGQLTARERVRGSLSLRSLGFSP